MKSSIRRSSFVAVLIAVFSLFMLPACTTVPSAGELALWRRAADNAAYVGAGWDLAANPAHRAHYALCQQGLAEMVKDQSYTQEKLTAALANLPALVGSDAALLNSGLELFVVGTGFIPIDSAPRIQAVVEGLQSGLARALARPTGTATRALAAPLPPQCTVPIRKAAK